jgi:hypothetical protein
MSVHVESSHSGDLESSSNGCSVSEPNILVTAMKHPYDNNREKLIIRAVESCGLESDCVFDLRSVPVTWKSRFLPYELKTFLIENGKLLEINGIENSINS